MQTALMQGIKITIDEENYKLLEKITGFLSREAYPSQYEDIALENEVGRYFMFRFCKKYEDDTGIHI